MACQEPKWPPPASTKGKDPGEPGGTESTLPHLRARARFRGAAHSLAWRGALATCGLTLNMAKLHVWNPHEVPLPQAFRETFPAATHTTQGFRVCGLPLNQADVGEPEDYSPWATGDFTRAFLEEAREATQRRLRVLAALVKNLGPNTEALHIALKIARVNLNARHVHLFRYCARPVIHEWAAVLQRDLLEWFQGLLDKPLPHCRLRLGDARWSWFLKSSA